MKSSQGILTVRGGMTSHAAVVARGMGTWALWRGRRTCVPDWWNRLWIPLCKALPLVVLRPVRRSTMRFQK